MRMVLVPVDLEAANDFVGRLHRHHNPVQGFSLGAALGGA